MDDQLGYDTALGIAEAAAHKLAAEDRVKQAIGQLTARECRIALHFLVGLDRDATAEAVMWARGDLT